MGWLIRFSVAFSPSSLARTNKQQLVTDIKLNKHFHNTSIYEFVSHYGVLRGTSSAGHKLIGNTTIRAIM